MWWARSPPGSRWTPPSRKCAAPVNRYTRTLNATLAMLCSRHGCVAPFPVIRGGDRVVLAPWRASCHDTHPCFPLLQLRCQPKSRIPFLLHPACASAVASVLSRPLQTCDHAVSWLRVQAWTVVPLVFPKSASAPTSLPSASSTTAATSSNSCCASGAGGDASADDVVVDVSVGAAKSARAEKESDPWEAWNNLRQLVESSTRLSVALEVTEELPSELAIKRWLAEPIKVCVCVRACMCVCMRVCRRLVVCLWRFAPST